MEARTVDKLSDSELRRYYVVAVKQYNRAYKEKKELEFQQVQKKKKTQNDLS